METGKTARQQARLGTRPCVFCEQPVTPGEADTVQTDIAASHRGCLWVAIKQGWSQGNVTALRAALAAKAARAAARKVTA